MHTAPNVNMSVPLVRLPPFDLIKGFVAVGRRMSVTQAAEDLCVTQSAISKQIRTLEDALGTRLLQRGHRSVSFTAEGARLFAAANPAVQSVQDVLGGLVPSRRKPVTITAPIGVASLWLLPRLGSFQRQHPDIEVRVAANNSVLDLRAEGMDLGIRYCADAQAPAGATKLFGEVLIPVASPALGLNELTRKSQLANQFLLEFDDASRSWLQWPEWFQRRGWSDVRSKGVLRFNLYDQVIQSALAGNGIALGRLALVGPFLKDGRLTALTGISELAAVDHGYWLAEATSEPRTDVLKVTDWIKAEASVSH